MIMTNHGKIFMKGGNVIQMLRVPPHELTEPLHKRGTSRREGKPLPFPNGDEAARDEEYLLRRVILS